MITRASAGRADGPFHEHAPAPTRTRVATARFLDCKEVEDLEQLFDIIADRGYPLAPFGPDLISERMTAPPRLGLVEQRSIIRSEDPSTEGPQDRVSDHGG